MTSLTLASCSIAEQRSGSDGKEGQANTVTIVTHDSFDLSKEQLKKFQDTTGYQLKTTSPGDASTVVNQLLLGDGEVAADGVFGVDNFQGGSLTREGVLAKYTPVNLPDEAKGLTSDSALVPIDQGQVCVNADKTWFKKHNTKLPETFEDLAKPEYAKLLVAEDPAQSSPGFAFLVGSMETTKNWKKTWHNMLSHGTKIVASWSEAYYTDFSGSEGKGSYPLVVSYSSSPAAEGGSTVNLDQTCVTQVEYAGVLKNAKNPKGAEAFVDFMLTQDIQASVPEQMYMYPVNSDVTLPKDWSTHASLAKNPITPDMDAVVENRSAWLKEFRALMEKH